MELRAARTTDLNRLYRWRKQDEKGADWFNGSPVDYLKHQKWFGARYKNRCVQIWIAQHEGGPVGQVRCDSNGELSYSIVPEWRGKGLAPEMLRLAQLYAPHDRLKACVDADNKAGVATLLSAGFEYRPDVEFYLWRKP